MIRLFKQFKTVNAKHYQNIDILLLVCIFILIFAGLILISSASMEKSLVLYETSQYFVIKQLIFLFIGLIAAGLVFLIPIKNIYAANAWMLFLGFFLLIIVLFIGKQINGSVRWISFGIFNLQASELTKVCIMIYLSAYIVRQSKELKTQWRGFLKPIAILSIASLLLLSEPDLGAVIVIMMSSMGLFLLAGVKLRQFVILLVLFSFLIVVLILLEPYRMARIVGYMDPWADAYGSGYQLTQALIGIGRGQWFGSGLGNSIQKLFYLPEAHTDFIFVVLAEEFGVLGCFFIISIYFIISWRILNIGYACQQKNLMFHGYLAYGVAFLFIIQAFLNIAVNLGLLPTKGLALPFLSYGGSNLIVNLLMFGIIFRIDYERHLPRSTDKKTKSINDFKIKGIL